MPHLPVVMFDLAGADGCREVPGIIRTVGDRPFCWLDDALRRTPEEAELTAPD